MKFWIKGCIAFLFLFSMTCLFAHPKALCEMNDPDAVAPMIITQGGAPASGQKYSLYREMGHWLSVSFGINNKYLKNTDVVDGNKAYFVVSREPHDGTVTVKKIVNIKGRKLILFMGQKFYLRKTATHPAFPAAVIKHFQQE